MAGDQDQSKAGDQDERTFEVVKLRIAFMQHITTLSGAAIVIILALAERSEPPKLAVLLMSSVIYFLAAALIAVLGVVALLINLMHPERVGRGRGTTGTYTTLLSGGVFSIALLTVARYVTGGTRGLLEQKSENIQIVLGALAALVCWLIGLRFVLPWILRKYFGNDIDEPPR